MSVCHWIELGQATDLGIQPGWGAAAVEPARGEPVRQEGGGGITKSAMHFFFGSRLIFCARFPSGDHLLVSIHHMPVCFQLLT